MVIPCCLHRERESQMRR